MKGLKCWYTIDMWIHASYYWPVHVFQWCAHSRVVVFHTLYRGPRDTTLCPYLVNFVTFYFSLTVYQPRGLPLFYRHYYPLSSSMFAFTSAAVISLAPDRSVSAYSYHCIPTRTPTLLSVSSYRAIIDRIAMKCTILLCLLLMHSPIPSN